MGGLFQRVFISFWVGILAFALSVAAIMVLNFRAESRDPRAITRQAAVVLQERGREGLQSWLAERNARNPKQRTLVIDPAGREILRQKLPERMLRRPVAAGPGPEHDPGPGPAYGPPPGPPPLSMAAPPGARIFDQQGQRYVVLFDPPPRRGPFSPPFTTEAQLGLLALALLISGLMSYLLARSISRPLVRLQATARSLAGGRLDERAPAGVASRSDEIGSLAREFDSMADRLAALIAARQQLLRDLSHELRSPLARLQMAVGLARQESGPAGPIDRIERESERLERMIAQILEYSRLERDTASLRVEEVDVVALAEQVAHDAEYESQSVPGRITVTSRVECGEGSPRLKADPQVLHSALDNVVRNALRHGGEGPIEVVIHASDAWMKIVVRDHGPGVPAADLQRIFEPFYRVARPDTNASSRGSGIGLAVAAKALELHGGRIVAENAADGGLCVTLTLPRGA